MKASNTLVMVQAYRLLIATMVEQKMTYPIHLGVTEAGEGEDGRIKSAVGIGALLEDGIGDTIRVSLTEVPEAEIPVAQKLLSKFEENNLFVFDTNRKKTLSYSPYEYKRRQTNDVSNIGHSSAPVVVGDLSGIKQIKPSHLFAFGYNYSVTLDKWNISDMAADVIYIGNNTLPFDIPGTLSIVCEYINWNK